MTAQRHEFQAETRQLLQLMIHSLYSNKEIFLRELISNASDAADKLRFLAIRAPELLGEHAEAGDPGIDLVVDPEAKTLTVRDNGIGMSRDEVIENLGTIAHSGTRKFLDSLSGDERSDRQLIGQFGVGFYSAFIVADQVTVLTRRADAAVATRWESDGEGSYALDEADKPGRGTDVILHLRADEQEFLEPERLRHLVRKYSDHIGVPIRLHTGGDAEPETINRASALWTRPKAEISDDDYRAFYTHLSHDPAAPLAWAHHKVEGNLEYTSLLYLPSAAPFDLWDREQRRGVHLYVKRVFIMDHAAELLPNYLRFVRGLVDSADLPLNVSRELLQGNRAVDKMRGALTRRVLDLLDELAGERPGDYAKFWKSFGVVLKEGLVEDTGNRERIAKLCRFASTRSAETPEAPETPGTPYTTQTVSLDDYIARMKPEQTGIYYLSADTLVAARSSPHLEGYRSRGFEVLLLTDRVDEWLVMHLTEYGGKKLISCARGAADFASTIETPERSAQNTAFAAVLERIGKLLGGRVQEAALSSRLTESPACLVIPEYGLSRRLEQMLRQSGQEAGPLHSLPILEINPAHPLVQRLKDAPEAEFTDVAELLFGQAVLAEGGQLEDPVGFVRRLNALLLRGADAPKSSIILT